jgi:hypothetical protein
MQISMMKKYRLYSNDYDVGRKVGGEVSGGDGVPGD